MSHQLCFWLKLGCDNKEKGNKGAENNKSKNNGVEKQGKEGEKFAPLEMPGKVAEGEDLTELVDMDYEEGSINITM